MWVLFEDLEIGMRLAEDLFDDRGRILLGAEGLLTQKHLDTLQLLKIKSINIAEDLPEEAEDEAESEETVEAIPEEVPVETFATLQIDEDKKEHTLTATITPDASETKITEALINKQIKESVGAKYFLLPEPLEELTNCALSNKAVTLTLAKRRLPEITIEASKDKKTLFAKLVPFQREEALTASEIESLLGSELTKEYLLNESSQETLEKKRDNCESAVEIELGQKKPPLVVFNHSEDSQFIEAQMTPAGGTEAVTQKSLLTQLQSEDYQDFSLLPKGLDSLIANCDKNLNAAVVKVAQLRPAMITLAKSEDDETIEATLTPRVGTEVLKTANIEKMLKELEQPEYLISKEVLEELGSLCESNDSPATLTLAQRHYASLALQLTADGKSVQAVITPYVQTESLTPENIRQMLQQPDYTNFTINEAALSEAITHYAANTDKHTLAVAEKNEPKVTLKFTSDKQHIEATVTPGQGSKKISENWVMSQLNQSMCKRYLPLSKEIAALLKQCDKNAEAATFQIAEIMFATIELAHDDDPAFLKASVIPQSGSEKNDAKSLAIQIAEFDAYCILKDAITSLLEACECNDVEYSCRIAQKHETAVEISISADGKKLLAELNPIATPTKMTESVLNAQLEHESYVQFIINESATTEILKLCDENQKKTQLEIGAKSPAEVTLTLCQESQAVQAKVSPGIGTQVLTETWLQQQLQQQDYREYGLEAGGITELFAAYEANCTEQTVTIAHKKPASVILELSDNELEVLAKITPATGTDAVNAEWLESHHLERGYTQYIIVDNALDEIIAACEENLSVAEIVLAEKREATVSLELSEDGEELLATIQPITAKILVTEEQLTALVSHDDYQHYALDDTALAKVLTECLANQENQQVVIGNKRPAKIDLTFDAQQLMATATPFVGELPASKESLLKEINALQFPLPCLDEEIVEKLLETCAKNTQAEQFTLGRIRTAELNIEPSDNRLTLLAQLTPYVRDKPLSNEEIQAALATPIVEDFLLEEDVLSKVTEQLAQCKKPISFTVATKHPADITLAISADKKAIEATVCPAGRQSVYEAETLREQLGADDYQSYVLDDKALETLMACAAKNTEAQTIAVAQLKPANVVLRISEDKCFIKATVTPFKGSFVTTTASIEKELKELNQPEFQLIPEAMDALLALIEANAEQEEVTLAQYHYANVNITLSKDYKTLQATIEIATATEAMTQKKLSALTQADEYSTFTINKDNLAEVLALCLENSSNSTLEIGVKKEPRVTLSTNEEKGVIEAIVEPGLGDSVITQQTIEAELADQADYVLNEKGISALLKQCDKNLEEATFTVADLRPAQITLTIDEEQGALIATLIPHRGDEPFSDKLLKKLIAAGEFHEYIVQTDAFEELLAKTQATQEPAKVTLAEKHETEVTFSISKNGQTLQANLNPVTVTEKATKNSLMDQLMNSDFSLFQILPEACDEILTLCDENKQKKTLVVGEKQPAEIVLAINEETNTVDAEVLHGAGSACSTAEDIRLQLQGSDYTSYQVNEKILEKLFKCYEKNIDNETFTLATKRPAKVELRTNAKKTHLIADIMPAAGEEPITQKWLESARVDYGFEQYLLIDGAMAKVIALCEENEDEADVELALKHTASIKIAPSADEQTLIASITPIDCLTEVTETSLQELLNQVEYVGFSISPDKFKEVLTCCEQNNSETEIKIGQKRPAAVRFTPSSDELQLEATIAPGEGEDDSGVTAGWVNEQMGSKAYEHYQLVEAALTELLSLCEQNLTPTTLTIATRRPAAIQFELQGDDNSLKAVISPAQGEQPVEAAALQECLQQKAYQGYVAEDAAIEAILAACQANQEPLTLNFADYYHASMEFSLNAEEKQVEAKITPMACREALSETKVVALTEDKLYKDYHFDATSLAKCRKLLKQNTEESLIPVAQIKPAKVQLRIDSKTKSVLAELTPMAGTFPADLTWLEAQLSEKTYALYLMQNDLCEAYLKAVEENTAAGSHVIATIRPAKITFNTKEKPTELTATITPKSGTEVPTEDWLRAQFSQSTLGEYQLNEEQIQKLLKASEENTELTSVLIANRLHPSVSLELSGDKLSIQASLKPASSTEQFQEKSVHNLLNKPEYAQYLLDSAALKKLMLAAKANSKPCTVTLAEKREARVTIRKDKQAKAWQAIIEPQKHHHKISQQWLEDQINNLPDKKYFQTEAIIEAILEKCNLNDKTYTLTICEQLDAVAEIVISEDGMEATCQMTPAYGGSPLTLRQIQDSLTEAKVTHGVDTKKIPAIIRKINEATTHEVKEVVIATGTLPVRGEDSQFILHFVDEVKTEKKADIKAIAIGELAMTREAPTAGIPGTTVTGESLEPEPGLSIPFADELEGVEINPEDENQLLATLAGRPVATEHGVNVVKLYTVNKVNLASGDVKFDGAVHVSGDVGPGVTIECTGDLIVEGTFDTSVAIVGGNMRVLAGIVGPPPRREKNEMICDLLDWETRITCAGDIHVEFTQNASLEASGSIEIAKSSNSCFLCADKTVLVGTTSAAGAIIGGLTYACEAIEAANLGTLSNAITRVCVGFNPTLQRKRKQLRRELEEACATFDNLEKILLHLQERHVKDADAQVEALLLTSQNTHKETDTMVKDLEEQISGLDSKLTVNKKANIKVAKQIYGGVILNVFDSVKNFNNTNSGGTFALRDETVTMIQ